jgi:hypothetical protein
MKRLIYQVYVGKPSKLYDFCVESVKEYCHQHGIHHIVQREPILKIKPDVFSTNRSKESYEKHGGFLPIYEKENAFAYLDEYDQIAIIDADIWIRPEVENIFDDFGTDAAWGSVAEWRMPITLEYHYKIKQYSFMQYSPIAKMGVEITVNEFGFEFFNMGMILINSQLLKPYIKGQTPKEFITRPEFKDFIDGQGPWKWSTDQTLLNYWIRKEKIPYKHMSWKWNALYKAVMPEHIRDAKFVHFFLKDHLPNKGEDVDQLIQQFQ